VRCRTTPGKQPRRHRVFGRYVPAQRPVQVISLRQSAGAIFRYPAFESGVSGCVLARLPTPDPHRSKPERAAHAAARPNAVSLSTCTGPTSRRQMDQRRRKPSIIALANWTAAILRRQPRRPPNARRRTNCPQVRCGRCPRRAGCAISDRHGEVLQLPPDADHCRGSPRLAEIAGSRNTTREPPRQSGARTGSRRRRGCRPAVGHDHTGQFARAFFRDSCPAPQPAGNARRAA